MTNNDTASPAAGVTVETQIAYMQSDLDLILHNDMGASPRADATRAILVTLRSAEANDRLVAQLRERIAELEAKLRDGAPPDGWVAVSERLPDKFGRVLALTDGKTPHFTNDNYGTRCYVLLYEPEHKEWSGFSMGSVTHWRPLPAPPTTPSGEER